MLSSAPCSYRATCISTVPSVGSSMRAGRRSRRCARTGGATSTETPIEQGSVTWGDRQGVNGWNVSGSRASASGRPGAPLPGVRGPVDRSDRPAPGPFAGDGEGVLLRPHWGEGAGRQGPLPGGVPRLWRLHPAARRQGRRIRILQDMPPGRDRAALDARLGARGDARVVCSLRSAAVVLRLVTHARAPTWGRGARATEGRRLTLPERRDGRLWELDGGTGGGRRGRLLRLAMESVDRCVVLHDLRPASRRRPSPSWRSHHCGTEVRTETQSRKPCI